MLSRHLLWKDYRQALPGLVGCWAILAMLIVLAYVRQASWGRSADLFTSSLLCALVAPTLAALACAGLLIGQERQTGSWNWSSSLPISPRAALTSKTIVWLISSILMLATLLGVYFGFLQLCLRQGHLSTTYNEYVTPYVVVMTAVIVPIEIYLSFTVAALVIHDTFAAMIAASVLVSVAHFLLSDVIPRLILGVPNNGTLDMAGPGALGIALAILVLIVGGGVLTDRVFGWRWLQGQFAALSIPGKRARVEERPAHRSIWLSYGLATRQPSQFGMLLRHSLASWMFVRIAVVVIATLFLTMVRGWRDSPDRLMVLYAAAGFLGLSVFAGDQTRQRYRFLADRGVDWKRLLVGHALVPALLLVALCVVAAISQPGRGPYTVFHESPLWYVLTLLLFCLGMFCALCTASTLINVCLLAALTILCTLAFSAANSVWQVIGFFEPSYTWRVIAMLVGLPLALVTILRHWLIRDRLPVAKYVTIAFVGLVLLPIVLEFTTNFMLVRNVPWRGLPTNMVVIHSPKTPLVISDPFEESSTAIEGFMAANGEQWNWQTAAIQDPWTIVYSNLPLNELAVPPELQQTLLDKFNETLGELDKQTIESDVVIRDTHESLIKHTAFWAFQANRNLKNPKLAAAAWRLNAKLTSLIDLDAIDCLRLIPARVNADLLRYELLDDEWIAMSKEAELTELINEPVPYEKLEYLLKSCAAIELQALEYGSNNPPRVGWYNNLVTSGVMGHQRPDWVWRTLRMFPPLRWSYERQLSCVLDSALQYLRLPDVHAATPGQPSLTPRNLTHLSLAQMSMAERQLRDRVRQIKERASEQPQ